MGKNQETKNQQTFLTDVLHLRERARSHIEQGAITPSYEGDVQQTISILQNVLATELLCWMRYMMNAISATGINSESVKKEFRSHARDERVHAEQIAERINQLGGIPNFNPKGLETRSSTQYIQGQNLVEMIKENLIAERIAVEHYRELIRFFGNKDPVTRILMESVLVKEEEHANDMHDLLVAYEGEPMLKK